MAYHFNNLVFEGGGVKGIAYVGALEVLQEEGILQNVKRVAGTSAGAMMAVLVGLRYTADEVKEILWDLNFKKFMDSSFGIVRDTKRLLEEFGWYKGDYFRNLMADLIKRKTGNGEITFNQLADMNKFRKIYLVGANLSTGTSETFCHGDDYGGMKIADAARISMSIPLFFASVKEKGQENQFYVDGGLLDNYSIKTFDREIFVDDKIRNIRRTDYYDIINKKKSLKPQLEGNQYIYNKETLGFRLDAKEDISMYLNHKPTIRNKITSFFTYSKALVTTLIDFQDNVHLHSDDWQRTIYIDTLGVRAIDFDISDIKKQKLVESGRQYTEEYLKWYNGDEDKANK
ncbi:MAG: patatin-like phospholipase family protein [Bacteroidales bacterium]|nr:patatin-like phospholipase family protein [Bacteroidales bacterium]